MGRPTQGVRVMNIKDDDLVSAVALVVESESGQPSSSGAQGGDQQPLDETSLDATGQ